MKIKSIIISNILSFDPHNDTSNATKIDFDISKRKGSLHILIGPNGSGKSNFVEVVNQVFKKAISLPCIFNEDLLLQYKRGHGHVNLQQVLSDRDREAVAHWERYRYDNASIQMVLLELWLNDNDIGNIEFLIKHRDL